MEVFLTEQFEKAYEKLTPTGKKNVRKALLLLGNDPKYPGLRVKKMESKPGIWEARASIKLRMTFEMDGERIILRNVGDHDRVLKNP
jgi:mRNA-degrading endonuclease RelE of RelBE toxin-antitoxin system